MSVEIDVTEVLAAASDMRTAASGVVSTAKQVVAKGALNVKTQLRAEASESQHFRFASSISYDLTDGGLGAEIGPRKGSPGSIANIAYFGGARGGGGTVTDPSGALDTETPRFIAELGKLAAELIAP